MNKRQRIAVDSCLEELIEGLHVDVFLTHLTMHKFISKIELQTVKSTASNDQMAFINTFDLLKHKSGAWECLIGFLKDNRYEQLVAKLNSLASDDSESDTSIKAGCGGIASVKITSATSTADSSKFPYVTYCFDGCESTDQCDQSSNSDHSAMDYLYTIGKLGIGVIVNNDSVNEIVKSSLPMTSTNCIQVTTAVAGRLPHTVGMDLQTSTELKYPRHDDANAAELSITDRFDSRSPSELLPDVIKLMKNQIKNVGVQMSCHRLIDQYSHEQLKLLKSALRRSLTEVLLSVVKFHCHDGLVVESFCKLLAKTKVDRGEIDWYQGAIDCLLTIICDENNLTTTVRKSTLKLLGRIALVADLNRRNIIGQKFFVEKICILIRQQLDHCEYDRIVELSWNCLRLICWGSVGNQKRFLDTGGIRLFEQCYKRFSHQTQLARDMTNLLFVWQVSKEMTFRQELMAKGNLEFLWEIFSRTEDKYVSSCCSQILSNFLLVSASNWPLGNPTVEQVKLKLNIIK